MVDVRKLTYLVIDSDVGHYNIVRMSLNQFGCRNILFANNFDQAVEVLQTNHIDMVIFTRRLRDDSGWSFVDWLRNPKFTAQAGIPILGLLSSGNNRSLQMAVRRGINHVVLAPVSAARLGEQIEKTMTAKLKMARTPNYYGPDRRRLPDAQYIGQDRRYTLRTNDAPSRANMPISEPSRRK